MLDDADPQAAQERRAAARRLLAAPLVTAEHDPELFRLLRRHESALDRWFTQRLGYRLHLDADTARLFKTGAVPDRRPLRHPNGRPLTQREHTLVALVLAATAAGPSVISLRDLVVEVRSAAAEVDIDLPDGSVERRAFVNALRWMITLGLAVELHEHVDRYVDDVDADAVLRVRPDRIALLLVPSVAGAADAPAAIAAAERRSSTRQWMRARLVEDPVLYRDDLDDAEWAELRRRSGEEERLLDEMFGFVLESRAEGVAAIDPDAPLGDRPFPGGGTLGHAALSLLDRCVAEGPDGNGGPGGSDDTSATNAGVDGVVVDRAAIAGVLDDLRQTVGRHWSKRYVESPDTLVREVIELLIDVRLLEPVAGTDAYRLRPAAARFAPEPVAGVSVGGTPAERVDQPASPGTLW